jgi:hypothetical protein
MTPSENTPVEIYAGTLWETSLLKSLLENAEIEVFLKDEIRGITEPWVVTPGGSNPIKVMVSADNLDKAMEVVRDFKANMNLRDG